MTGEAGKSASGNVFLEDFGVNLSLGVVDVQIKIEVRKMGSFAWYQGSYEIPENQRDVFIKQMRRILDLGGMMDVTEVKMFDIEIPLLRPVRQIKEKKIYFDYNYFEDRGWETAYFDEEEADLWSEKIGGDEFSKVITAAYMLYELTLPEYGFAVDNGDFVEESRTAGWLNHILGTKFCIGKRANLWDCVEQGMNPECNKVDKRMLDELIPDGYWYALDALEMVDLLCIMDGTDQAQKECSASYLDDILACKQEVQDFLQQNPDPEILWNLLEKPYAERYQIAIEKSLMLAVTTLMMPARVFVYLAAEILELNFWKTWRDLSSKVYHDERMSQYVSKEKLERGKKMREEPFAPIRTSEYLRQDNWFNFSNTPDEIKDQPNYYLSDDDRLYWWDGSDEVRISEEVDAWLKKLAVKYRKIMQLEKKPQNFEGKLYDFMDLLDEINDYYCRIYPFETMFYEFTVKLSQKEYCAAVQLIKEIADSDENRKAGKIIHGREYGGNKNVIENKGRLQVKRIYAVMANQKLRKKYFGF